MILRLVIVLGVSLTVASGCCVPKQWEALSGMTEGYSASGTTGIQQHSRKIWFDATKQIIAVEENITGAATPINAFVIQKFKEHKQYTIMNKTCKITTLPDFDQNCIPANAQKTFGSYFGIGNSKLPATFYHYTKGGMDMSVTMTNDTCVPVGALVTGSKNGADFLLSIGYFEMTPGIKNRNIFVPPPSCTGQRATRRRMTQKTHGKVLEIMPII